MNETSIQYSTVCQSSLARCCANWCMVADKQRIKYLYVALNILYLYEYSRTYVWWQEHGV